MTEEDKKHAILQVWLAWKELYTLNAAIEKLGHAAHEAGATTTQHQLEVIHHNLDKTQRELVSTMSQIKNIKGETK
jgi:hypothetical protein